MKYSSHHQAVLASAVAMAFVLSCAFGRSASASEWTGTGNGGISGFWTSVSPADPGWDTPTYPNAVGAVAQITHDISLIGNASVLQNTGNTVTVGQIHMGDIGGVSWTIAFANNSSKIALNNGGAGAVISNTNSAVSTSNVMVIGNPDGKTGGLVLQDDLHIINASASTATKAVMFFHGPISGTGNIFVNNSAPFTSITEASAPGGIRFQELQAQNAFVGNTTLEKGLLAVASPYWFGSAATNTVYLGATTANADQVILATQYGINIPNNIVVNSASTGRIAIIGVNVDATDMSASTFSGSITLNRDLLIVSQTGANYGLSVSGQITGPGSPLVGDGAATGAIGGGGVTSFRNSANDYSGDTVIGRGTFIASGGTSIPDGPGKGNVVMLSTVATTFGLDGDETINGLTGGATAVVRPDNRPVYPAPPGNVVTSHTLTVGNNDADSTFAGVMQDNGTAVLSLTKIGNGTLNLSGNNTYTGPTNVNGGTLLINGAPGVGGNYTVASGATLGGIGVISSNVVVQSGGHLTAGDATNIGALALASAQVAGQVAIKYDGGAQTIDTLSVSGMVDLTGASLSLQNLSATSLSGSAFPFLSYGALTGTFASTLNLPAGYGLDYNYQGLNEIALVSVSNVPGDFNNDGVVNGADFAVWQNNFPTSNGANLGQGDSDGDGDVDGADFITWQIHYSPGGAVSPTTAAVPEPATISIMLFGGLACGLMAARRRGRK